jgi:hypothetical protein
MHDALFGFSDSYTLFLTMAMQGLIRGLHLGMSNEMVKLDNFLY